MLDAVCYVDTGACVGRSVLTMAMPTPRTLGEVREFARALLVLVDELSEAGVSDEDRAHVYGSLTYLEQISVQWEER